MATYGPGNEAGSAALTSSFHRLKYSVILYVILCALVNQLLPNISLVRCLLNPPPLVDERFPFFSSVITWYGHAHFACSRNKVSLITICQWITHAEPKSTDCWVFQVLAKFDFNYSFYSFTRYQHQT